MGEANENSEDTGDRLPLFGDFGFPSLGRPMMVDVDAIATAERLRGGSVQIRTVTGQSIDVDRLEAENPPSTAYGFALCDPRPSGDC